MSDLKHAEGCYLLEVGGGAANCDCGFFERRQAADDALFLEYHGHSAWAKAKVASGLCLNPEARAYIQGTVDTRNRFQEALAARVKEAENAESVSQPPATDQAIQHGDGAQPNDDRGCEGIQD